MFNDMRDLIIINLLCSIDIVKFYRSHVYKFVLYKIELAQKEKKSATWIKKKNQWTPNYDTSMCLTL